MSPNQLSSSLAHRAARHRVAAAQAPEARTQALAARIVGLAAVCVLVGCGVDPATNGVGAGVGSDGNAADQSTADTSTRSTTDAGASTDGGPSVTDSTLVDTADASATDVANPDVANPDVANPDVANPDVANPDVANPDITSDALTTPEEDAGPKTGCTPACTLDELCVAKVCTKIAKPCGGACSSGQFCDQSGGGGGVCTSSACSLPTTFADVQKVSYMEIAPSDKGCDLDGDGGVDNVFGKLLKVYPAANTELLKSIQDGLFILLFNGDSWKTDGTPFVVNGYLGELDSSNASCSPTASFTNCKYTVDADNFGSGASGVCPAQVRLKPATVKSGQLDAGGAAGTTMTITLPVVGGLDVTLSNARLLGEVTGPTSWQTTKKGRICGVMTLADFKKAIDAVPAEAWKEIGLDKTLVEQVLATFLAPDIDLNKDGTNDAISMALLFEGVPGQITKVIP